MNEQQRRAAQLIARGFGNDAVAREIGVHPRTIIRWKKSLPDFQKAVSQDLDPAIRGTLEAAMLAFKRDGVTPDWPTRVSAAKALAALGADTPKDAQPVTVFNIYKQGDE